MFWRIGCFNVDGGTWHQLIWQWYSDSCGGVVQGTGLSLTVAPSDTTNYYVRAEGPCGNTICAEVEIDVIPGAIH